MTSLTYCSLVNNVQVDHGNLIVDHRLITANLLIYRNVKPIIQYSYWPLCYVDFADQYVDEYIEQLRRVVIVGELETVAPVHHRIRRAYLPNSSRLSADAIATKCVD
jgi:hypothetical protein